MDVVYSLLRAGFDFYFTCSRSVNMSILFLDIERAVTYEDHIRVKIGSSNHK